MDGCCGAEAGGLLKAGQVVECEPVVENPSFDKLSSKDFAFSTSFSLSFFLAILCFRLFTPIQADTVIKKPKKIPSNKPPEVICVERYKFNNPMLT